MDYTVKLPLPLDLSDQIKLLASGRRQRRREDRRHSPYRTHSSTSSPASCRKLGAGMRRISVSTPAVNQQLGCSKRYSNTASGELKYCSVGIIDAQVYVRRSTVPGAGLGLFANKPIMKGEWITYFQGEVKSASNELREQARHGVIDSSHYISVDHFFYIDCITRPEVGFGGGSFANDSIGCAILLNAEIVQQNDPGLEGVFLRATVDIATHDEILCKYADSHWEQSEAYAKRHQIPFNITQKRLTVAELRKLFTEYHGNIEWMTTDLRGEDYSFPAWSGLTTDSQQPAGKIDAEGEECLAVEFLCYRAGVLPAISLSYGLQKRMKTLPEIKQVGSQGWKFQPLSQEDVQQAEQEHPKDEDDIWDWSLFKP